MKLFPLVFLVYILAGCAGAPTQATDQGSIIQTKPDGTKVENLSDYALYARISTESKPLFEMTCPPAGCVMLSLKVNAPMDKGALAAPVVPESLGATVTKGFFGLAHDVLGLGPWYFGGKVLSKAFDAASGKTTTTTTTSIDNSNRSTNSDSSNRAVTTTTTTNTDNSNNSVNNSNNRNCQSGNPTGTTTPTSGPATC